MSGTGIDEFSASSGNRVSNNFVQATTKYNRYSWSYDEYVLLNNSTPTNGVWSVNDIVKVADPVAFGAYGYICTAAGTGAAATWTKYGVIQISASATYDPPSLAAGATQSTTVTLTGATVGKPVACSFSVALGGTRMWAEVTFANTVTVYHRNDTGATVAVGSGTLTVKLI